MAKDKAFSTRIDSEVLAKIDAGAARLKTTRTDLLVAGALALIAASDDTQPREAQPVADTRRASPRAAGSTAVRGTQPPRSRDVTPNFKRG